MLLAINDVAGERISCMRYSSEFLSHLNFVCGLRTLKPRKTKENLKKPKKLKS